MEVTKYVITNNLSVLYNTREEAEAAFEAEVAKLETAFARGAFKRLYTVVSSADLSLNLEHVKDYSWKEELV